MTYFFVYNSPIGKLTISECGGAITSLDFGERTVNGIIKKTALIEKTVEQLEQYFKGERKAFDIPLAPAGTVFQMKVWNALKQIPYGETRSYKQIAAAAGNPKAVRAVGGANNRNPISIIVPCHRVIGSNGKLVGYASGLDNKKTLLELEAKTGNQ